MQLGGIGTDGGGIGGDDLTSCYPDKVRNTAAPGGAADRSFS